MQLGRRFALVLVGFDVNGHSVQLAMVQAVDGILDVQVVLDDVTF